MLENLKNYSIHRKSTQIRNFQRQIGPCGYFLCNLMSSLLRDKNKGFYELGFQFLTTKAISQSSTVNRKKCVDETGGFCDSWRVLKTVKNFHCFALVTLSRHRKLGYLLLLHTYTYLPLPCSTAFLLQKASAWRSSCQSRDPWLCLLLTPQETQRNFV